MYFKKRFLSIFWIWRFFFSLLTMSTSLFVFVHTDRFWTFNSYFLRASTNFERALKYSFKLRVKREKRFCVKQRAHIYKAISMYFHCSVLKTVLQFWCKRGTLHFRRISGNVQIRVWCVWPSASHYPESVFRYKSENPVHKHVFPSVFVVFHGPSSNVSRYRNGRAQS